MARLRGVEVSKSPRTDAQVWQWRVDGALWQFKLAPWRELYCQGLLLRGASEHLLCVDDAVLFSLGYLFRSNMI